LKENAKGEVEGKERVGGKKGWKEKRREGMVGVVVAGGKFALFVCYLVAD
jgi:hypothetical protein